MKQLLDTVISNQKEEQLLFNIEAMLYMGFPLNKDFSFPIWATLHIGHSW